MKKFNFLHLTFILLSFLPILVIAQNGDLRYSFIPNSPNEYILRIEDDSIIIQDIFWQHDTNMLVEYQSSGIIPQVPSQNDDLLEETIWLPDNAGTLPLELCYNLYHNKLYVYDFGRQIIIVDLTSGEITGKILVSEKGNFENSTLQVLFPYQKLLAYNAEYDKLYCISPDHNLVIIDGVSDNIIEEKQPGYDGYLFHNIIYDDELEKLFWSQSSISPGNSRIRAYDGNSNSLLDELEFTGTLNPIFDIISNPEDPEILYASTHQGFYVFDANDLSTIDHTITASPGQMGKLTYNSVNNSVYANMYNGQEILVFNGSNGTLIESIPVPFERVLSSAFNPSFNKIYFMGVDDDLEFGKDRLYFLDCATDNLTYDIFPGNGMNYCDENDMLYIASFLPIADGSKFYLRKYNGETNQLVTEIQNEGGGWVLDVFINEESNKVYFGNFQGGTIGCYDYDLNLQPDGITNTGMKAAAGIYNKLNNSIYVPNYDSPDNHSLVSVIDGNNNNIIAELKAGRYINEMTLNELTNKIFISQGTDNSISVINCNNNTVSQSPIVLNSDSPNQIISGPDYKVYVGCNGAINVLNAFTEDVTSVISFEGFINDFIRIPKENFIIACTEDGKLIGINGVTNELDWTITLPYDGYKTRQLLISNGKLYILKSSGYYSDIDIYTIQTNTMTLNYLKSLFLEASYKLCKSLSNEIFAISHSEISIIDNADEISDEKIDIDGGIYDIVYNESNNRFYVYYNKDIPYNSHYRDLQVNVYDASSYSLLSSIYLDQQIAPYARFGVERSFEILLLYPNSIIPNWMVFDSQDNKMFIQNNSFSNVSVIECASETATYRPGFNWVSFPTLDRSNGNPSPETVLGGMTPNPATMTITGLPDKSNQTISKQKDINNNWTGGLDAIESQRGYKLELPADPFVLNYNLEMSGTRLDPQTSINVYKGFENWVGYFPFNSQSPYEAFADLLPDDLEIARGYDWILTYINFGIQPKSWIVFPQGAQIRHGDMVIVEVNKDRSFTWGQSGQGSSPGQISAPENFSYSEEADYTPILIELDENEMPDEIGAFVNDTCIGACTVSSSDSLSFLRAYMAGEEGDSVSFQLHYPTKSTQVEKVKTYYVFNEESQLKEKRPIKVGENKRIYRVSFKEGTGNSIFEPKPEITVSAYPNPSSNIVNIVYFLPSEMEVRIEILDLYGRSIAIPEQGKMAQGAHRLIWNIRDILGNKIKPGMYSIRLTAANTAVSKKIVIN